MNKHTVRAYIPLNRLRSQPHHNQRSFRENFIKSLKTTWNINQATLFINHKPAVLVFHNTKLMLMNLPR